MVVMLVMSATIFARPSGVQMQFPVLNEGGGNVTAANVVITVTGENVIYVDGHVVTLNELRRFLARGGFRRDALMLRSVAG